MVVSAVGAPVADHEQVRALGLGHEDRRGFADLDDGVHVDAGLRVARDAGAVVGDGERLVVDLALRVGTETCEVGEVVGMDTTRDACSRAVCVAAQRSAWSASSDPS